MTTTKLNKTTQRAKNWIELYNSSNYYSVCDWYKSRTPRKESIENSIKQRIKEEGLKAYKIVSANGFYFTCGYKSQDGKTLYIETVSNIYEIAL